MLEGAETVVLPFVVLGELRAGFSLGKRGLRNEQKLQHFLARPGVEVAWPGNATTRCYAQVYRQLRRQGTPIPTNDLWIAAIVLEHDLLLATRDRHFDHLPQIITL